MKLSDLFFRRKGLLAFSKRSGSAEFEATLMELVRDRKLPEMLSMAALAELQDLAEEAGLDPERVRDVHLRLQDVIFASPVAKLLLNWYRANKEKLMEEMASSTGPVLYSTVLRRFLRDWPLFDLARAELVGHAGPRSPWVWAVAGLPEAEFRALLEEKAAGTAYAILWSNIRDRIGDPMGNYHSRQALERVRKEAVYLVRQALATGDLRAELLRWLEEPTHPYVPAEELTFTSLGQVVEEFLLFAPALAELRERLQALVDTIHAETMAKILGRGG